MASFIENFREQRRSDARQASKENEWQRKSDEKDQAYERALAAYYKMLQNWRNAKGMTDGKKYSSVQEKAAAQSEEFNKQFDNLIDYMMEQEGTSAESKGERQDYAMKAIAQIMANAESAKNMTVGDYMDRYGDDRDKEIYDRYLRPALNSYRQKYGSNSDESFFNTREGKSFLNTLSGEYFDYDQGKALEYLKGLNERTRKQKEADYDSTMSLITDYKNYGDNTAKSDTTTEVKTDNGTTTDTVNENTTTDSGSEDDFIEFSYKPGDTFGQKIIDLGIGTDKGLWGDDGDVAYYTQQLIDGDYLDANGNVKLGVPIRLKKRK